MDDDGLDKFTMRRLATDLGVEAMTLYHHFPNKDAILDGVAETVLNAMTPEPFRRTGWTYSCRCASHFDTRSRHIRTRCRL